MAIRKPLWLGIALMALLLVVASVGLYQLRAGEDPDEPTGGPIAMPSTQGDFTL